MKKSRYGIIVLFILAGLTFYGCEVLEPEVDNYYDLEDVKRYPHFAEGLLLAAYNNLPESYGSFPLSYACDEAVTNDQGSNVKTVVAGGWTSSFNPFSTWEDAYEGIYYINYFLEEIKGVEWKWKEPEINKLYEKRMRAEGFGLRAYFYFSLLQAHAGLGTNGELLGVPLVDHVLSDENKTDNQIPRSTIGELVAFILADCDSALAVLPDRYVDTYFYEINEPFGEQYTNRINGMAVRMIRAKTLLYAASPSFSDGTYTYQAAAESAAEIMDANEGLTNVNFANHNHLLFYNNEDVATNNEHPEVFWYSSRETGNSWEASNYPPSLYGEGATNPSQDLVNAFPMEDGTPVQESKINSSDPYLGRDPRLSLAILYNEASFVRGEDTITINTKSGSQDARGSDDQNASQTGYYLRKFMNVSSVNLDPAINSRGTRYYVYARYTDALLMYAEAANEAAGPDGDIGGYTARQVINAIRDRAGITSTAYVDGLSKEQLAQLIRNERRIEMCFENQRFWDLRRWGMVNVIKQPVFGVQVSADGSSYTYNKVENRNYADYQVYGPIPYLETLKYDIAQNQGW